jgi:hypothetical protein
MEVPVRRDTPVYEPGNETCIAAHVCGGPEDLHGVPPGRDEFTQDDYEAALSPPPARARVPRLITSPVMGGTPLAEPLLTFTAKRGDTSRRRRDGDQKPRGQRDKVEGPAGQFLTTVSTALAPEARAKEVRENQEHQKELFGMLAMTATNNAQQATIAALQQEVFALKAEHSRKAGRGGGHHNRRHRARSESSSDSSSTSSSRRNHIHERSRGRERRRSYSHRRGNDCSRSPSRSRHTRGRPYLVDDCGYDSLHPTERPRVKKEENVGLGLPANRLSGSEVIDLTADDSPDDDTPMPGPPCQQLIPSVPNDTHSINRRRSPSCRRDRSSSKSRRDCSRARRPRKYSHRSSSYRRSRSPRFSSRRSRHREFTHSEGRSQRSQSRGEGGSRRLFTGKREE